MSDKVYAVYSIPKSPEYRLEKIFKTKKGANDYIKQKKEVLYNVETYLGMEPIENMKPARTAEIFDIQIEEVFE